MRIHERFLLSAQGGPYICILLVALGLGCGDDGSSGGGTTTTTTTDTEVTTPAASGSGGSTGATESSSSSGSTTREPFLSCPDVPRECGEIAVGWDSGWTGTDYEDDVRCGLERLLDAAVSMEDATPVEVFANNDLGDSYSSYKYIVRSDGSVLRQYSSFSNGDDETYFAPVDDCALRPITWYQNCLDDPKEECVDETAWVESCVEVDDYVCPS